jgi:hypothetical protein
MGLEENLIRSKNTKCKAIAAGLQNRFPLFAIVSNTAV